MRSIFAFRQDPAQFPIRGFWPFPKVPHGFHSCRVIKLLHRKNAIHNPKVDGSIPSSATKPEISDFSLGIAMLRSLTPNRADRTWYVHPSFYRP